MAVATGDINGDGAADAVVAAPLQDVGTSENQGRVYVFSGSDGSLLGTIDDPDSQAGAGFGYGLAVGDTDGDTRVDIIVGAANTTVGGAAGQGRVFVFSGVDLGLLRVLDTPTPQEQAQFGYSVAAADLDGDGGADIVVSSRLENVGDVQLAGRVYAFSGRTGELLTAIASPDPQEAAFFGDYVTAADLDADGHDEILVSAFFEDVGGNPDQGRVYAFSPTGSAMHTFEMPDPDPADRPFFGFRVAAGDIDGDGSNEVVATAHFADAGTVEDEGRAYVFSGSSGAFLRALQPPASAGSRIFGASVVVGDVLGDSRAEVIVGARQGTSNVSAAGMAYVFDGNNGALVAEVSPPGLQPDSRFADNDTLALGNVRTDTGRLELVAAAPYEDVGSNLDQGRAYVYVFAESPAITSAPSVTFTEARPNRFS